MLCKINIRLYLHVMFYIIIHDFIISHQIINDIYADKMEKFFIDKNYITEMHNIKKYGYPNFLLLAKHV